MIKGIIKEILPNTLVYKYQRAIYKKKLSDNFQKIHGYCLNIDNPKTWNEKIHYRKKYGNKSFMAKIADKYLVREYVKNKIGEKYLIKLYGVYEHLSLSDFTQLPEKFVIKSNHASGPDFIEIVTEKSSIDIKWLINKMNSSIKKKYGIIHGEDFYQNIKPKIIIEEYLKSPGLTPDDYKVHCFNFNGNFKAFIQVDRGRYINHRRNIYDLDWNLINMKIEEKYPHIEYVEKPKKLKEIIEISKKLSEDFDYVRVDLYLIEDQIFFGELTMTHGDGMENIRPVEIDYQWGALWDIDKQNSNLYNYK
ncbi:ATP-grasp fold amidoligase family protein [Photobacterium damselae]|uniref:ATP-grasp fold amidoligase family protein n=1 Tax=Photobacterium damselae TaxID=38293 RepID=UPI00370BED33